MAIEAASAPSGSWSTAKPMALSEAERPRTSALSSSTIRILTAPPRQRIARFRHLFVQLASYIDVYHRATVMASPSLQTPSSLGHSVASYATSGTCAHLTRRD